MKRIKKQKLIRNVTAFAVIVAVLLSAGKLHADRDGMTEVNVGSENEKEETAVDLSVNGNMTVTFIDVGQGDSILVTQNGHAMLVDTGNYDAYDNVQEVLKENDVSSLDYFVVTHMDSDHMQSASDILEDYNVETLLCANDLEKDTMCVRYFAENINKADYVVFPSAGEEYVMSNVLIDVLAPEYNEPEGFEDSNDYSIILKLTYGETSYLLTADASEEEFEISRSIGMDFSADVVKLMHHGSAQDGSNSEAFLNAVDPEYAVISCGYGNTYGHPHLEVVDLLQKKNISTFRTDLQGTVISISDGNAIFWNTYPTDDFRSGSEINGTE